MPPIQAEPLADALAHLIGDERLLALMGAVLLRRAEAAFRIEHVVEAIPGLYEELLHGAGLNVPRLG